MVHHAGIRAARWSLKFLVNWGAGAFAARGAACGLGHRALKAFTTDPHVTAEADHRVA